MPVVFLRMPVANPAKEVPLIFVTVEVRTPVLPEAVTSPVIEIVWSPVLVPLTVAVAEAVKVAPSARVSVAPVAGAVIATLLMLVADATPRLGVVITGEVSVLFVSTSVVARPTKVSVWLGSVSVPVLTMEEIVGVVSVTVASVPPEIETLVESCVAIVPNPRLVRAVETELRSLRLLARYR